MALEEKQNMKDEQRIELDAETAAKLAGAGGALTGAVAGSVVGPVGSVVGGLAGGLAGALIAGVVVGAIEDAQDPTTVEEVGDELMDIAKEGGEEATKAMEAVVDLGKETVEEPKRRSHH